MVALRSLCASAAEIRLDGQAWPTWAAWRFRDEAWQREAWRLYDLIPELRFAASWVGSCLARVEIFIADVDELGRVQGRSEDPEVAALSDKVFGGPGAKAEALRLLGLNLTVAGEAYVLGQPGDRRDEWFVLSSTEVRRRDNLIFWGDKRNPYTFDVNRGLVSRIWTPHPARIWCSDSPTRSSMSILIELERLTKFIFSQIDSRLVGAGMLIMPSEVDFPSSDDQSTNADTLMNMLAETGAASLRGEGTAAAQVPLIVQSPREHIEGWKHFSFATELSKQAIELRDEAIRRLGIGMDMPLEVLTGKGDINHWGAWHIDESGIKLHIEPLMTRICDALNDVYMTPGLKYLKKDPARYTFAFDTAPLTVRPQRLTDAINLYNMGLLSAAAVRDEGDFSESQAPEDEETAVRFVKEVVLRDPALFGAQGVRTLVGVDEKLLPPELATPPPPPPKPGMGVQSEIPAPVPERTTATDPSLQASAHRHDVVALAVAADACVRRALERAGSKLLPRGSTVRQYPDVPAHELHTRLRVLGPDHATRLLDGAFTHLPGLLTHLDAHVDATAVEAVLVDYCQMRLLSASPHDRDTLLVALTNAGLIQGR